MDDTPPSELDDDIDVATSPSGIVALVGRPNVGKSTLFNRLTGRRTAIVDEVAGLTRDRLYGVTDWRGRCFTVIDTAGLDPPPPRGDEREAAQRLLVQGTQEQTKLAIEQADLCCFLVDVREGITALDEEIAVLLRNSAKPVIVVGNKAERTGDTYVAQELHRFGLGEPICISALQGTETGELLDQVVAQLPPPDPIPVDVPDIRLAIVGRPNVGKSSLLNALAREERALVSPVAGTTRDTVDTLLTHKEQRIRIVDTAGIRRRGVITTDIEHYSVLRALNAIERADVALMVIDAAAGIVSQDRHVAGYAMDAGKGLVVIANKWDIVDHEQRSSSQFLKEITAAFDFVPGAPVLTVSALEGRNVNKIMDTAVMVAQNRQIRIPTGVLNSLIRDAVAEHPPRIHKGRRLKILYATQARAAAPTIVLFVNDPELVHFSYTRYLENRIRAVFGFAGVRLQMVVRKRQEPA